MLGTPLNRDQQVFRSHNEEEWFWLTQKAWAADNVGRKVETTQDGVWTKSCWLGGQSTADSILHANLMEHTKQGGCRGRSSKRLEAYKNRKMHLWPHYRIEHSDRPGSSEQIGGPGSTLIPSHWEVMRTYCGMSSKENLVE